MSNIDQILRAIMFTPTSFGWGIPTVFTGGVGVGKTTRIQALRDLGLPVYVLVGSTCDPADVRGLPLVDANGLTKAALPSWVAELRETGGVLFLDEFNYTPLGVQAPMLRLLHERMFGEHFLGHRVRIIAAQNPSDVAKGSWQMGLPAANRLMHLQWPATDMAQWCEYMSTRPVAFTAAPSASGVLASPDLSRAAKLEADILAEFSVQYPVHASRVAAFVRHQPGMLERPVGDRNMAFTTPRSLEMLARVLTSAAVHGLDAASLMDMAAGTVGPATAGAYITWLSAAGLPDPLEILTGQVQWSADPHRVDLNHAVADSVTAALASRITPTDNSETAKTFLGSWYRVMGDIAQHHTDVAVPGYSRLVRAGYALDATDPNYRRLASLVAPVVGLLLAQ